MGFSLGGGVENSVPCQKSLLTLIPDSGWRLYFILHIFPFGGKFQSSLCWNSVYCEILQMSSFFKDVQMGFKKQHHTISGEDSMGNFCENSVATRESWCRGCLCLGTTPISFHKDLPVGKFECVFFLLCSVSNLPLHAGPAVSTKTWSPSLKLVLPPPFQAGPSPFLASRWAETSSGQSGTLFPSWSFTAGVGNLWPPGCCRTTTPTSRSKHGQRLRDNGSCRSATSGWPKVPHIWFLQGFLSM